MLCIGRKYNFILLKMNDRSKINSFHLSDRTMPLKNQNHLQNQDAKAKQTRSASFDKSFMAENNKLPMIRIKKVMKKIGASQNKNQSFVPPDEDQATFRRQKWLELRKQYSTRRGKQQPFQYELDQIVLDCWEYGESFGRKTIWKKYKQNFDELTFDTLKVVRKKKL